MMNLHTWKLINDDLNLFKEEVEFLKKEGHEISVSYTDTYVVPNGYDNSGDRITMAVLLATDADQRRLRYIVLGD